MSWLPAATSPHFRPLLLMPPPANAVVALPPPLCGVTAFKALGSEFPPVLPTPVFEKPYSLLRLYAAPLLVHVLPFVLLTALDPAPRATFPPVIDTPVGNWKFNDASTMFELPFWPPKGAVDVLAQRIVRTFPLIEKSADDDSPLPAS